VNLPVTNEEYVLSEQDVIITRTDLSGRIVYANEAFLKSSGFQRDEVMGEPQNIIRHPDMPAEVYRDMWDTIGMDLPWTGVVKNRRKTGGYYWVTANVTPVFERGRKVGYMSVRTRPSDAQITNATELYRKLNTEGAQKLQLSGGIAIRKGAGGAMDWLLRLPVDLRLWAIMATLMAIILLLAVNVLHPLLPDVSQSLQAFVLAGIGIAIALTCGAYLTRNVLDPLRALNDCALGVLNGHIREQFPEQGDAQAKLLGRMLNQMNAKLVGVLIDAKISIDVIRDTTQEFARGNADLATRTDEQASAIEQTTASLAEVTETAEQNALGAERANVTGRETSESAEVAAQEVQKTVEVMARVREHSRKISEITSVIDSIAFQTNIIALNASVEAARAGQYGRGFAVVATEVRSLAQRTTAAAREIKTLIETSLDTVTAATQAATRAGETMNTVEQAVTRLTHTLHEIARASQGQSEQITQINIAVGQVSELTQRNAALVERSAAASTDLQLQTQSLDTSVSIFQIDDDHVTEAPSFPRLQERKSIGREIVLSA
jgi:aerotaxis receptor